MLVVSSREFRNHQKMYFDLIDDKEEQVIVQRGRNKSYLVTPISETDKILANPAFMAKLDHSIAQADRGELIRIDNIKEFFENL
jgi:antitoxin YefM